MPTSFAPTAIIKLESKKSSPRPRHPRGLSYFHHVFHKTAPQGGRGYPIHVRHPAVRAAPRPVPPVLRAHRPPDPLPRNRHRRRVLLRPPPHPARAHLHPPRRQLPPQPAHRPRFHRPSRQRDRLSRRQQIPRRKARRQAPLRLPDRQPGPRRQTPRPETSPAQSQTGSRKRRISAPGRTPRPGVQHRDRYCRPAAGCTARRTRREPRRQSRLRGRCIPGPCCRCFLR